MSAGQSRLLLPRVIGALSLSQRTFAVVAADGSAGVQAGLIVVLAGIVEGSVVSSVHGETTLDTGQLVYSVVAALIGWVVWGGVVYAVSTRIFDHPAELRPVLRAVAFTHAPALVYGLALIPGLTTWAGLLLLLSLLW
ncbi:MAG: hypothetical protein ACREQQ_00800, partial [Candidatus Binatia bacterium]